MRALPLALAVLLLAVSAPEPLAQIRPRIDVQTPRVQIPRDQVLRDLRLPRDEDTDLYWTIKIRGRGERLTMEATRWRGHVAFEDPAASGEPSRVTFAFPNGYRGQDLYFANAGDEILAKRIVDAKGRAVGAVGFHAGGGYVAYDDDRDGRADLLYTQEDRLSDERDLIVNARGTRLVRDLLAGRRMLGCSPSLDALGAAARTPRRFGPLAASLVPCPDAGAASGAGLTSGGGRPQISPMRGGSTSLAERLCSGFIPSRASRAAGEFGRNQNKRAGDPRQLDFSRGFDALLDELNPIPDDIGDFAQGQVQDGIVSAIESFARIGIGWAISVTNAIGRFIEGSTIPFINAADRDLFHVERAQERWPDADIRPNPETVEQACSAGSSSPFCGEACRSGSGGSWCGGTGGSDTGESGEGVETPPEAETGEDGAGSEGGTTEPVDPTATPSIEGFCQGQYDAREQQSAWWDTMTFVQQECDNPAASGQSTTQQAGAIRLRTFCGATPDGGPPNLSDIVNGGGGTCPPGAEVLPGGGCRGSAGVPRGNGPTLDYGYLDALGLEIRLRPCPDATCNPIQR